ncbi:MAG TPA: threonine ammonia-lyase [Candidatus Polarisedimenticolia bacterium]|nr:threonine ammonia-lyase [Candidatus Polarisedimenticolia bacterium]
MSTAIAIPLRLSDFKEAQRHVSAHAYHTPLLTSRLLSEKTGFDVRLKAEVFQKTGSYKIRGPLNKFRYLTPEQRKRGVICSSAGNHAQGVALAAAIYGMPAVVVMAENATKSKVEATRAYGAEVVQHGTIWDEANEKAKVLCEERQLTYIHPFDDFQLMAGQGTVGLEISEDFPLVEVVIVPIGGGGLISGISAALKLTNPRIRVIGVESSGAPGMKCSIAAGHVVTLDKVDCVIDGLKVKRVGEKTFQVVQHFVDEIVTLPDDDIFDAMIWIMSHCKLVVEGAAAAPVAALLHGLVKLPPGTKVACVLSGGNINLDQIRGLKWN